MPSSLDQPCTLCGSKRTVYFYPRPGPAPGNMIVCSNSRCEASVAGIKRANEARATTVPMPQEGNC